jgi:hypothetical protein
MIKGTVTRPGWYADGKERCEITISRGTSTGLQHRYREKKRIYMIIGNETYEAGVHETKDGTVWISAVLFKEGLRREHKRLVDALAGIEVYKGDKVIIYPNESASFLLEKSEE